MNKKNSSRTRFGVNSIFYFVYVITLFTWMFGNVMYINNILTYLRYFTYILLIICLFNNYKTIKFYDAVIKFLITICIVISSYKSGLHDILILWLFILASKNIEFKKLIKIDIIAKTIFIFLVIMLYFLGLTKMTVFYSYGTDVFRSAMGFAHPNLFGCYIMSICLDYIYLRSSEFNLKDFILIILTACIVYFTCRSRTSTALILAFDVVCLIFPRKINKLYNSKVVKLLLISVFAIFTLLSVYIVSNYNYYDNFYFNLDKMLSGRIVITQKYVDKYDIKPFGQNAVIYFLNGGQYFLDNAYYKLLYGYGFFVYIIVMYIYIRYFVKALKYRNIYLIIIGLTYLTLGFTENAMFILTSNIFLLYPFSKVCNVETIGFDKDEKES